MTLKTDCRYFRGDVPCRPHKQHGVHCIDERGNLCPHYEMIDKQILIIKLGAIGDVIRTTPLLHKLKTLYPRSKIFWLTWTPDILPSLVDEKLDFSLKNIIALRSMHFDLLINLDKDREACALCSELTARTKRGYILKNGVSSPIDAAAESKYFTGIFDDVSKANTKSYPEEMFEICGFKFNGEKYILDTPPSAATPWKLIRNKKVIGLNTGCGGRWTSRLWEEGRWISLAKTLKKKGFEVVLLGGEQEDAKNRKLARAARVKYFGTFPLAEFIDLVNQCDLVVTGVTMAMHITIGLNKKIVLFNNIFNKNEFELYNLGIVLEPDKPCRCFYQAVCTNPDYRCMERLPVPRVVDACVKLLLA
ncbi:MAG: glycosyltransferase family 9 protein [bacterium]